MKKSQIWLYAIALLFSTTFFTACEEDNEVTEANFNIVEFAQNNSDYSLLVDALIKADLVDALSGNGPLTLFAPKNPAFQAFLDAAGTNTIENTPADVLRSVLTNHVIGGEFPSTSLVNGYASTLSSTGFGTNVNNSLYINIDNGVKINGSVNVIDADNEVSNGIIHEIDAVIALPSVVTFALADPNFSSLVAALTANGLTTNFVDVLSGAGPFTVFAPTNSAFQNLLDSNPDWSEVADIPVEVLEAVLLYHVTDAGNVRSDQLVNGQEVTTLSNAAKFSIDLGGAQPMIMAGSNTANIVVTDVQASNGVIHVINEVILP